VDQVLPERLDELSFSRSFFGYDPLEVRAFVSGMKDQVKRLEARHATLISGNGTLDDRDLAVVIDSAMGDISRLLEAARIAAKKIRERAEHDASDGLTVATDRARKLLASAESQAFALRKAAWETSTEVLESMKAEGVRMRAAAEHAALEIIGNGERKAHRKLAAARRDSENAIQMATVESERLLGLARANGQEIIRAADARAEETREQVSALEVRHRELLEEMEIFRSKLEGPSAQLEGAQTSTVRVIHHGDDGAESNADLDLLRTGGALPEDGVALPEDTVMVARARPVGWADGTDSVRLVRIPTTKARLEVDALELADEVARLREEGAAAGTEESEQPGESAVPGHVRLVHTPAGASRTTSADREAAIAGIRGGVPGSRTTDELAALFLQLRMKEATTAKAPAEATTAKAPAEASAKKLSPLQRYDRMLLPVTNRALRAVKRQLIDVQREQVEALKEDPEEWRPERSSLASYLVHVLSVMEREAFERGHTAAAEMTDTRPGVLRGEPPTNGSAPFVSALFDDVAATVENARRAELSSQEVANSFSRVYRAWRTDEAERRLRFLAGRAYHSGLVKGLVEAGVDGFRIEVNEGCDECAAFSGQVVDAVPTVPAHVECRCTIAPA
jgi:hypothetical protein